MSWIQRQWKSSFKRTGRSISIEDEQTNKQTKKSSSENLCRVVELNIGCKNVIERGQCVKKKDCFHILEPELCSDSH